MGQRKTQSWLARLRASWSARQPRRVDELVAVEFDEQEGRIIALAPAQAEWNQRFCWNEISRVCFKDEGPYSSDLITIELGTARQPAVVLVESRGGDAFFGALAERGYFPEHVCRHAIKETGGAAHCWPPR